MAFKHIVVILYLVLHQLDLFETCTVEYTRTPGLKVFGDITPVGPTGDIDGCEAVCTLDTSCLAIYFDTPVCYTSTVTTTESAASSVTHSLKGCAPDTTVATSAPITTPSSATCLMVRSTDSKGGDDTIFKLTVDYSSCRDLCNTLENCQSVTYDGSQCKIYTGNTTTQSTPGSTHDVKTKCLNGITPCCFNTHKDTSGGNDQMLIISNTLRSCETICENYLPCTGVSGSGTECRLFTSVTNKISAPGNTYSHKTCSGGATMGEGTFTNACTLLPESGGRTVVMDMVVLVVMATVAMINY